MPEYIKRLIMAGESQVLDFKFEISDYRKIARTLVAFSNTDGGRLLIGVKDNGAIAGVRSDEEYFMVEGASRLYCRPEVRFSVREWQVEGRKVLEVIIEQGKQKPYRAQEPEGTWTAYIRQGDQNFKAPAILLKVWERQQSGRGTTIFFRNQERTLLRYLEVNESISLSKFRRLAGLSAQQAEMILADFIVLGLLKLEFSGQGMHFSLVTDYRRIIKSLKKEESGLEESNI